MKIKHIETGIILDKFPSYNENLGYGGGLIFATIDQKVFFVYHNYKSQDWNTELDADDITENFTFID